MWRHRLGKQIHQGGRLAQPVYYNTTGGAGNGTVRQRPQVVGYARFDAVGGFDPNHLSRMIDRVFECADPSVWMGYNKLLFRRMLKASERAERFLVIARSSLIGSLAVGAEGWRSSDIWLLSLSGCADQQEAMLLMSAGEWIRSTLGLFTLQSSQLQSGVARLVLDAEE